MKQPLKTSVSCEVEEIAINGDGKIFAILKVRFKKLGYEKPDSKIQIYVDITKEIKRDNET